VLFRRYLRREDAAVPRKLAAGILASDQRSVVGDPLLEEPRRLFKTPVQLLRVGLRRFLFLAIVLQEMIADSAHDSRAVLLVGGEPQNPVLLLRRLDRGCVVVAPHPLHRFRGSDAGQDGHTRQDGSRTASST